MAKIKYFCVCHGHAKGSKSDRAAHKPYGNGYRTTATYEARMRVGRQWLNQKQAAKALRRQRRG